MENKFADKFKINSARLTNWNYSSPGNYFLTLCTCNHNKFFGEINNEQMVLSKMGIIANQFLFEISEHFANVCLTASIVMPNHVHILVHVETPYMASQLTKNSNVNRNNKLPSLNQKTNDNFNRETPYMASLQDNRKITLINYSHKNHPNYFLRLSEKSKQLIPKIVQQYKSVVTRKINPKTVFFGWQSGYHCMIVENEIELLKIKNYIINNPKNWRNDRFYN